ncbi:AGE family epimerase/isomerase [Arcanobacterium phocisimile]|uniref:AGE family epimerase/isomerase n=1 Tax=Arcanobacterium phocisimile TaxID=1302235 RepID=A0ABX7IGG1_9ACTO|nr:AGE family epimerase/isomerase [Arcanobacterium phocisimile]QRV02211.1 AGE family epimerase/isomerase [Arcanobacterium phocisimile]
MVIDETTQSWLAQEFHALVDFARRSRCEHGFSTLDADGEADRAAGLQLWINCRMTHVFCLATLNGDESARAFAQHGIDCLRHYFYDEQHGGFFTTLRYDTDEPLGDNGERKAAYAHAFVLLAASSGIQAGLTGAQELYDLALTAHETYFWEPEYGLARESWNRDFTETEDYRGANANMHTLEASLAAWDATSDVRWLEKSASILSFVLGEAEKIGWRIPEHFDSSWQLLPDFNRDQPADPFRPFGLTPGHGIEWARLTLHFWAANNRLAGDIAPELHEFVEHLPQAAYSLFTTALADGWDADGAPGIVYTTDFDGEPVVHERMHWTVCEGLGAAAAFATYAEHAGDSDLRAEMQLWFDTFLDYAKEYLIETPGRWIHELDRTNTPSGITWPGKPDVYHAAQCVLMPKLDLTPCFAGALAHKSHD